jgi:hypothetical protein
VRFWGNRAEEGVCGTMHTHTYAEFKAVDDGLYKAASTAECVICVGTKLPMVVILSKSSYVQNTIYLAAAAAAAVQQQRLQPQ